MANEKRLDYQQEKKRLAERLKQYHDFEFTPGVYEHSIFGMAAKLLEVEAVEVVRCKDCKHFVSPQGVPCCDEFMGLGFPNANGSDFCSYGERREGE